MYVAILVNQILLLIQVIPNVIKLVLDVQDRPERRHAASQPTSRRAIPSRTA